MVRQLLMSCILQPSTVQPVISWSQATCNWLNSAWLQGANKHHLFECRAHYVPTLCRGPCEFCGQAFADLVKPAGKQSSQLLQLLDCRHSSACPMHCNYYDASMDFVTKQLFSPASRAVLRQTTNA